jgi:NADH dehydrogenase
MKVAVTGATGFVGRHVVEELLERGMEAVLMVRDARRVPDRLRSPSIRVRELNLSMRVPLQHALAGCDGVVHCAGINRERGMETYKAVHVQATQNLLSAARTAQVRKMILLSFLRARPDCDSPYHESKWAAEEIARNSDRDYTILKAGVIYGRGDHMLDHLSHALHTFAVFATVGLREQPMRPVAVRDVARIIVASLRDERLSKGTFAVMGPEEMTLAHAVQRVGEAIGRKPTMMRMPVVLHAALARLFELTMRIPLVSRAQVRILSESLVEPLPYADELPQDLKPRVRFDLQAIREGLPPAGAFTWRDCRCVHRPA